MKDHLPFFEVVSCPEGLRLRSCTLFKIRRVSPSARVAAQRHNVDAKAKDDLPPKSLLDLQLDNTRNLSFEC